MREFIIKPTEAGGRADKFLFRYMPLAGKSFIYKMFRKKNITLNGAKAAGSEILKDGDKLTLYLSDETIEKFRETKKLPLTTNRIDIIYEDENILILNKPAGLLTQPVNKNEDSLTIRAAAYLNQDFQPACANRLDRNTSGLVMFGKNLKAVRDLNEAVKHRRVKKMYLAIVIGSVREPAVLKSRYEKDTIANIGRITNEGDEIETRYTPLETASGFSLLEVELITGKSHQIRLHLKNAGYPVLGDNKYGDVSANIAAEKRVGTAIKHQCLFAYKLIFATDGIPLYLSGREFTAPPPREFLRVAQGLFEKYHTK